MSRKTIILLILITDLLWPSDEARIRKLVRSSVTAVQNEDVAGVMKHVAFAYSDEHGLSYMLLKKTLERQFNVLSDIDVEYSELRINVVEDRATALLDLLVLASVGENRGYILGDLREDAHLELELEKNPAGKWLVTGADFNQGLYIP
jgi:hypothetical protein